MARDIRYKDIQLPQLRSFCVAASERNFTTAAHALGLSVPTVWNQVRALERRLRTSLMRRRGRAVELTPEGRLLLDLVHPHVSGLDSLVPLFQSLQAGLPRQLVVASNPHLISSVLLEPSRTFSARFPSVRLKLHVSVMHYEVVQMVERGEADLGMILYDRDVPHGTLLTYERLFDLQFVLLTPRGHPLARKKKVTPHDLVEHPLILPPTQAYARQVLERLLRRHDLEDRAHIVLETALLDIIRKYVAAGLGISLVHLEKQSQRLDDVEVRVLDPGRDCVSVAALFRKGAHLSEPVQQFRQILLDLLGQE